MKTLKAITGLTLRVRRKNITIQKNVRLGEITRDSSAEQTVLVQRKVQKEEFSIIEL